MAQGEARDLVAGHARLEGPVGRAYQGYGPSPPTVANVLPAGGPKAAAVTAPRVPTDASAGVATSTAFRSTERASTVGMTSKAWAARRSPRA